MKRKYMVFVGIVVFAVACVILIAAGPKEKEMVNFKIWLFEYDDKMHEDFQGWADEYHAENPNVLPEIEIPPLSNYLEMIKTRFAAGDPPEVMTLWSGWLMPVLEYLGDWNEVLPADFRDNFYPKLWDEVYIDGKQTGIPEAVSTRALFCNPEYFEQAGISDYPSSWDELYEVAKKLKRAVPGVAPFAIQGKNGDMEPCSSQFYAFSLGNGADIVDANGKLVVGKGFRSENIEAMAFLQKMVMEGLTQQDPVATGFMDLINLYTTGRAAMIMNGPWVMFMSDDKGTGYHVVPVPNNGTKFALGYVDVFSIYKDAENKEEIGKFMEWLYEKERRYHFSTNHGMVPALKWVGSQPHFTDDPNWKIFIDQLDYVKFHPKTVGWDKYMLEGVKQCQAAYIGDANPTEAIDSWQSIEP